MLMHFQKELSNSEAEIKQFKDENIRLKGSLEHDYQQIKVENARLKQMIQEISNRGGSEVDQWRKLVEQEKGRADKAENDIKQVSQQLQVR